jgi:hypothetical protein
MENDPDVPIVYNLHSLQEAFEQARLQATKNIDSKDPFDIGSVFDFPREEILQPPDGVRIFVSFNRVLAIVRPGPAHTVAVSLTNRAIQISLVEKFGFQNVYPIYSPTIRCQNIKECHSWFSKKPDGGLFIGKIQHEPYYIALRNPTIVVEVGHTYEGMDLLLREAEVLLNRRTSIEYVMLVNLVSRNQQVNSVRFMLCRRRRNSSVQSEDESSVPVTRSCSSKFSNRRCTEKSLERMSIEEIEGTYDLEIVQDETVTRDTIRNITFRLEVEPFTRNTQLEGSFEGEFEVVITEEDNEEIFRKCIPPTYL